MDQHILWHNNRYWIPNPTDPLENFADKWAEHPERATAFLRVATEGQDGICRGSAVERQESDHRDGRTRRRRIAGRSRGTPPPAAGPVSAAENRFGGAGGRRSLLSGQKPGPDQASGVRRRGMIWWLENPTRARSERQGVAELAERVSWLKGVRWYLSNGAALAVDFEIEHDGDSVPLTMTYAEFHPNAPPIVVPRDGSRLSTHQYGAGGNLCLEYRADNWETAITGAMMIESAHRLIAGERDVDGPELPSAHAVSIGQSVRGSSFRFLLTPQIEERLKAIEPGQSVEIGVAEKYHAETFTVTIAEIDGATDCAPGLRGFGRRRSEAMPFDCRKEQRCRRPHRTASPILLGDLGLATLREQALAPDRRDGLGVGVRDRDRALLRL